MRSLNCLGVMTGVIVGLNASVAHGGSCPLVAMAEATPTATMIFSGVATTLRGLFVTQIVTFDVERVWQGPVGKQVTAYQFHPPTPRRLYLAASI